MNIVIMAGGQGSRLGGVEKPLLDVCGSRIIERIIEVAYRLSPRIHVAVSPNTPRTREWCIRNNVRIIDTPGRGYSYDIGFILDTIDTPVLFLPADTPFLTMSSLRYFVEKALSIDTSIITLLVSKQCFPGQNPDENPSPIGISLFKKKRGYWANIIMCRFPDLLDIDTLDDLELARRLCENEVSRW